ncbi:hypothetical protein BC629DRAFT_1440019 [Irpex lacteus]|nr:hypothetical protein BC629DRAFT_1440019 [Irpex lacteus]
MSSPDIPKKTQILVVGGGPAGSYAAAVLAREGFSVVLLEASRFPRYHIGESLLPSIRAFLQFIDAEETIRAHGFTVKPGAAVKLNQYKREGYTDFVTLGHESGAWNVVRSEFDDLLLRHAAKCGVTVFQETKVTEIQFSGSRPISATWNRINSEQGHISFDYLLDASGRNGIMSVKYLKSRCFSQSLKNVAHWGYWEGTKKYMPGTTRENAVWIEALNDESGWVWFIPLHDGSTSVGVVMDKDSQRKRRNARLRRSFGEGSPILSRGAEACSGVVNFWGCKSPSIICSAHYIGINTRYSSEEKAAKWHDSKVGTAYTRFLIVVLGTYKQMRNQSVAIMSDINEDNFDRAFDLLRPVLTGSADVSKTLRRMNWRHLFAPTDPDMYQSVGARIDPALMYPSGPILTEQQTDEEAKHVLAEINARKPIHHMYNPRESFITEAHHGLNAVLTRGQLGLIAA